MRFGEDEFEVQGAVWGAPREDGETSNNGDGQGREIRT
jgi:hypothetical protein